MHTYLTFDVGTTAIKICLFDKKLKPVAQCTSEYDLLTVNGLVELDSSVYWRTICQAIEKIRKQTSLSNVKTISITTQGETLIPVDIEGKALHNAIVWLDGRAEKQAKQILELFSPSDMYNKTGVTDINGFVPLAKLLWIKQNEKEIYDKTHKFLLLEDYLLLQLTRKYITEPSLLTSTAWYDNHKDVYLLDVLEKLELDVNKLPQILECGEIIGDILPCVANELGLPVDVKIISGAMDQTAAAIGGGGLREGIVTATIGTAMAMTIAVPEDKYLETPVIMYRAAKPGQFFLLLLCTTAGIVFKWLKDIMFQKEIETSNLDGTDIYDRLCERAANVPPGANGLIVLPYFSGSLQPTLLPQAKGAFFGLTLNTSKEDMVRAVLEGIGFMLRENIEMLRQLGIKVKQIHFFGGGSKNPIWNQIIADITGVKLILLEQKECASIGVAMLAAVAIGDYPSLDAAQKCNQIQSIVVPNKTKGPQYDKLYQRYLEIFQTVKEIF